MSFMGYLRGFVPWIVAGVVSSFDWRWGAVGGLAASPLLLLQDLVRGVAPDALILEASTVGYFVVVGAVAVFDPDSALSGHTDVASFAWLAATAWGTLAIRRPFTLGIARRQTPREYWDMPEFFRINSRITAAWGTGFTFIGVSVLVCDAVDAPLWAGIAAHAAGLAAPMVFTGVHPARARARLLSAPHAPTAAASR